jgi:hypothetical protein
VKEYASLIADGIVGEVQPEQQRMLRVMGDRVEDLNNMVDDMLDVSRHNSGLLGANRAACDVADVITRLLPELGKKASLRSIALETRLADELPQVFCDPAKVGRVVVNLINLHRSRALVLDIGPCQWLLLQCAKQDRVPEFLERVEEERQSLNRNRPSRPLPMVRPPKAFRW